MKKNEIKNINLLGHKRKNNNQIVETRTEDEEKEKQNNPKNFSSKKPEFHSSIIKEENGINLEEEKETKINTSINMDKKMCQLCNSWDNVLCFSSLKNFLDYISKNEIFLFKNFHLGESFKFCSPKMICSNCLLTLSKNRTEFEKFIESKKNKKFEENDNLFNDLFENPNLKIFNDIATKKKETKNQNKLNEKFKVIFEKLYTPEMGPSSLNNPLNNNNIFNYPKIYFDFLNFLNYFPASWINYNMPFNQNISSLNITNYYSDKNSEIKDNIIYQNNLLNHPIFYCSDILHKSFLNKPEETLTQNNTNILNLYQFSILNKNLSMEKNSKNENGLNTSINNINIKNDKKKISKYDGENYKQNNIWKNFTIIQNKDCDEIFHKKKHFLNKYIKVAEI